MNYLKTTVSALAICACLTTPTYAFYDTTDKTEPFYVMPNQTAFMVPDSGANKDSQGSFPSVDYLNANKVPAKLVIVPHAKMSGSGGTSWTSGWDFYVPTARIFVVIRNPFFQDWTKPGKGTNPGADESFCMESKDSIEICTGLSIGAHIEPQDAAKYLYNFGLWFPPGVNTEDPKIQYQSVFYARPLHEVMDGIVHAKVQAAISSEFSSRPFKDGYSQKIQIIQNVYKSISEEFGAKGITIEFIGYNGSLQFEPEIQKSIDKQVIAVNDVATALTYATSSGTLETLRSKAWIDAIAGVVGTHGWDGHLPNMPSVVAGLGDIGSWFSSVMKSTIPEPKKQ